MNRYAPRFISGSPAFARPRSFYHEPRYQLNELYSTNGPDAAGDQSASALPSRRDLRPRQTVEAIFSREAATTEPTPAPEPEPDGTDWKARALALQADMDNFRQRQARRADEAGLVEKERLLTRLLPVVDNLSRALAHADQANDTLQQGVALTHRELLRLLEAEGVSQIETVGQPFDPNRHEAVALTRAEAEPDTIVQEIEAGYMLGEKLLRPARVVVAA